jgi:hypothetical protein
VGGSAAKTFAPKPDSAGKKQAKDTRFAPGVSGNPAGRRPGSGKVAELREKLSADVPGIMDAVVKKAKEGDVAAARLVLERIIPVLKPVEVPSPVDLPDGLSLEAQGSAVLAAAARGDLPTTNATQLLQAIAALGGLRAIDDFERRLQALENVK